MARKLRLETEGGVYHVLNRGNYRGAVFATDGAKEAFLRSLGQLSEDEPEQKALNFATMSSGWAIGSASFKKALLQEHREAAGAVKQSQAEWQELKQAMLDDALSGLLRRLNKTRTDLLREGKSVPWKLALAAALKNKTVATNRWLAENLRMGNLHEVSRKVSAWQRNPERDLARKLQITPNPMA